MLSECPNRELAVLIAYIVKTVTYSTEKKDLRCVIIHCIIHCIIHYVTHYITHYSILYIIHSIVRNVGVTIAQKKQRHVSLVDQKEAPSSREKRTPPDTGKRL